MSIFAKIVDTQDALEACLTLRRAVFVDEQGVPESLEVDDRDALDAAIHIQLLDEESGQTLGTARLIRYDDKTAKVQRVAVVQSRRNSGCGQRLMECAEQVARQNGYGRMVLDAQLSAEGFYRRLGYRRVNDTVFLDAGIEHVRMEKQASSERVRQEI